MGHVFFNRGGEKPTKLKFFGFASGDILLSDLLGDFFFKLFPSIFSGKSKIFHRQNL